jgi:TonB-linked SusC/RagA family outer membrane protein
MKQLYLSVFFLCLLIGAFGLQGAAQQLLPVKGVVRGADHKALIGANVLIPGSAYRAQTDSTGRFQLMVPPGRYRVRATYIGYLPANADLKAPATDLILVLNETGGGELGEVVVSTGYQQFAKERATGSFVAVDKALLNRSVSTDILDRLRDVVPGLSFNTLGTRISVRGQSTLFSNAAPLIVVDGFPYNQPIENLNPADVETVTVLKDAAAASIWGARAGNGVIVITTNKGGFNRPVKVSLNANVTVGARPDLYYRPQMSSGDYIELEKRLFTAGYFSGQENADGHLPLSPVVGLLASARDGQIGAAAADQQIAALKTQDVRRDLQQYFYRGSVNQQYSIGLDGGSMNQRYAYTAGFDRNLDSQAGNGFDRVTLSGKNTWTMFTGRLEIATDLNLTETRASAGYSPLLTWNKGETIYPYAQLADASGSALPLIHDYRDAFVSAAPGAGLLNWQYKPLDELRQSDNHNKMTDYRVNTGIAYHILTGLKAQVLYQYDHSATMARQLQGAGSYYARDMVNRFTQAADDGTLSRPLPQGGILDLSNGSSVNHDGRLQLDYDGSWGKKNELSAIAGYELQSLRVTGDSYRLYGYDNEHATTQQVDGVTQYPFYDNAFLSGSIPLNLSEAEAVDHYRSWYANAAYTYDRRLTLSGSARLDQSNLFGVKTNQKGVPLWSAGAAWELSKEAFYHAEWLPYLKLRATFGYNGNVNKNLSAYTTASYFDGSGTQNLLPYASIINPPNPGLRWERIRHINFGLDFGSANRRINGTVEFYLKKGLDLIGNTSYAPSSGITLFRGNTADTKGHGVDLNLDSRNLTGRLKWSTNFILSYVKDQVTAYGQVSNVTDYLSSAYYGGFPLQGRPLYALYSYKWAGLDPQTGDPQGYLNGSVSKDYGAMAAAATPENLVYNGPSRPVVFGALRNTFTYGGLSLSANISYSLGYYFRRTSVRYGDDDGLSQQHGDYAMRWQHPGDELRTVVPSLPAETNIQRDDFYTYSSALVDKGDHIRLRDINLAYAFGKGSLSFLPGTALQVYIYANNLGIIWRANKDHLDPDAGLFYPSPRTIAGGIRLTY